MQYSSLFDDFGSVSSFVLNQLRRIFTNFYENPKVNFLFNMALLPIILMFAFDILLSVILSVRFKRVIIFNPLSPRSWTLVKTSPNRLKSDVIGIKIQNYNKLKTNRLSDNRNRMSASGSLRYNHLTLKGRNILNNFRSKLRKGKVVKVSYVDWKESLMKNNIQQTQMLREIYNKLFGKKKK